MHFCTEQQLWILSLISYSVVAVGWAHFMASIDSRNVCDALTNNFAVYIGTVLY